MASSMLSSFVLDYSKFALTWKVSRLFNVALPEVKAVFFNNLAKALKGNDYLIKHLKSSKVHVSHIVVLLSNIELRAPIVGISFIKN